MGFKNTYNIVVNTDQLTGAISLVQGGCESRNLVKLNLISFIAKSASEAVAAELNSLEAKKTELQFALNRLETELNSRNVSEIELTKAFNYARELFISGQLVSTRKLVERFIHEVVVYPDRVHIYYNFGFSLEPLKHEIDTEAVKRRLPRRASALAMLQKDLEQYPAPAAANRGRKNAKTPQYPRLADRDTTVFSLAQPINCAVAGGERLPSPGSTAKQLLNLASSVVSRNELTQYNYQNLELVKTIIPSLKEYLH